MPEHQEIEWKESWRDEYLKWLCGYANAHGGTLPTESCCLDFEAETSVLSAVVPTEDARVFHVRFYETCGKDDRVTVRLPAAPAAAVSVDLNDREVASDLTLQGNGITVSVKANCLGQIRITL